MNLLAATLAYLSILSSVLSIPLPPPAPAPPAPAAVDILLTGLAVHTDEEGCCESCGYSYCPSLDTCVRPWEIYCKEFDFPYNVLYKGSGIIIPDIDNNALSDKKS